MASVPETDRSSAMAPLAARQLSVPVNDVSITKLTGDASTRSYSRAQAGDASVIIATYSAAFDENERAVVRLARAESADPSARLTFANDPCAHTEVTALLLEAGLPVPKVLATSGADAMMLIQDVGDVRLQDWLSTQASGAESEAASVVDAYRHALKLAVKIQDATERALEANSICSHLAFDEAKLRWELGFFFANYFNRYLHARLEPAASNAVQADFKALCSELAARPRVLTHRDYHARNLMMPSHPQLRGEMFIIDYQDARMGPASYDVASLLRDPYTALSEKTVEELVLQFIEMKAASKLPLANVDDFRVELDLMIVQRMLKAIGTYASQAAAGNPIYVPYITPALDRALAAMKRLNRFEATCSVLEQTRPRL